MKALLLILTVFVVSTTANSAPSPENNKAAIEALAKCSVLLQEEEVRWKTIHTNPVTDIVIVTKDGSGLYGHVL